MAGQEMIAYKTAEALMQINAIKLNVSQPFVWASGLRAPIYCDNRQTLSFPAVRRMVSDYLVGLVREKFPGVEVIAGVATGAIAHGVLVAERLDLPFVYVRNAAKGHGLANRIEGRLIPGAQVVVIEDLISTGMSSIDAVKAIRDCGGNVLGLAAIFSYELPAARQMFQANACMFYTLSNYSSLLKHAESGKLISPSELKVLMEWRKDPAGWSEKY